MNEVRRMQYMEAMGIEMFVPRVVLPNAAESSQCTFPAELEPLSPPSEGVGIRHQLLGESAQVVQQPAKAHLTEEPKQSSEPTTMPPSINWEDKVEDLKSQPTPAIVVSDDKTALDGTVAVEFEQVSFVLHIWQLDDVMVIDSHRPGEALPTETLLTNILISTGLLPVRLPTAEVLAWPLVNSRPQDQAWSAARQMVNAFIEGRLSQKSTKRILLFGEEAFKALAEEDQNYETLCFKLIELNDLSVQCIVLPSLATILYEPVLKRNVWQSLQVLA